jgi:hypothetical protein
MEGFETLYLNMVGLFLVLDQGCPNYGPQFRPAIRVYLVHKYD